MKYEDKVSIELSVWEQRFTEAPGWLESTWNRIGNRINQWIPAKVHSAIAAGVKTIVRTALFGAEYTPNREVLRCSLEEADHTARKTIALYQKIAAAEGAGTGAGGLLMNAVDFPALIAIKMKCLFELAHIYGFDTNHFAERIYILHIFQLAFSSAEQRRRLLKQLKRWETEKRQWTSETRFYQSMDWDLFQKEYRDALDFRKILQMVPGIGAVAGAWANYTILEELGETAMNAYRMRRLSSTE